VDPENVSYSAIRRNQAKVIRTDFARSICKTVGMGKICLDGHRSASAGDPNGYQLTKTERLFLRAPEQGRSIRRGRAITLKSGGWRPSTIASTTLGDKNPSGISRRTDRRSMPSRWASSSNRSYMAGDQVVRPSSSASDRLEQRKINSAAGAGLRGSFARIVLEAAKSPNRRQSTARGLLRESAFTSERLRTSFSPDRSAPA
jgi:hypothetical protein